MVGMVDDTGERCVPWSDDLQVVYEHLHRYAFAAPLCAGARVLDLGSGEGYGADLLLRLGAARVTGVEIDAPTVAHARRRYPEAEFRVGSMLDVEAVEEAAYDVVTCFEALEHVADHAALLRVVRRALRPGGLLVVSTPERDAYNAGLDAPNPFHVRELTARELAEWLSAGFGAHLLWRQAMLVGSALLPETPGPVPVAVAGLQRVTLDAWHVVAPPPAPYLVAVASDGPLPVAVASLAFDVDRGAVRDAQREAYRLAEEARQAHLALRRSAGWEDNAAALRAQVDDLTARAVAAEDERGRLAAALESERAWRAGVEASRAWVVVRLLRAARGALRRRRRAAA